MGTTKLPRSPLRVRFALLQSLGVLAAAATRHFHGVAKRKSADPARWCANAIAGNSKWAGQTLDPLGTPLSGYKGMIGVLSGLAVGETLIGTFPRLKQPMPTSKGAAARRCLVGLSGLMAGFLGLRSVEKRSRHAPTIDRLRFARHAYVPVWILVFAPMIFEKLEA